MDQKPKTRKKLHIVAAAVAVTAVAGTAFAFTSTSGIGGDFYDIAQSLATGPVGATVAMGGVALAAFFLFKQQILPAIGTAMGGMAIAKADTITSSLGGLF